MRFVREPILSAGDCFAFVLDEEVIYAEVLTVLDAERFVVWAFYEHEPVVVVDVYGPDHVTHRISPAQMDRAARAGWPADPEWFRRALMD